MPDNKFYCYGCYDKEIEEQNAQNTILKPTRIEKQKNIETMDVPNDTLEPGGRVTLPKYGWATIPVCKACFGIVQCGDQKEDSLFYKSTVVTTGFPEPDSTSVTRLEASAEQGADSTAVVAYRRTSQTLETTAEQGAKGAKKAASGMLGGMKKKAAAAAEAAKKAAEEQAEKHATADQKEKLSALAKQAGGALDEARLMASELDSRSRRPDFLVAKGLEEWSTRTMQLDEDKESTLMESAGNKYAGNLGVLPLNRIEHIVSGPPVEDASQREGREASGNERHHELQLMVRDAKGRCNDDGEAVRWIWSMKFCGENGKMMQMRIAAALLEAKDRFKDDKAWGTVDGVALNKGGIPRFGTAMSWQKPLQSAMGSMIDKAKAAAKNKIFSTIASLFEKVNCISASPWLSLVLTFDYDRDLTRFLPARG